MNHKKVELGEKISLVRNAIIVVIAGLLVLVLALAAVFGLRHMSNDPIVCTSYKFEVVEVAAPEQVEQLVCNEYHFKTMEGKPLRVSIQ